jgi:hypothetical protein
MITRHRQLRFSLKLKAGTNFVPLPHSPNIESSQADDSIKSINFSPTKPLQCLSTVRISLRTLRCKHLSGYVNIVDGEHRVNLASMELEMACFMVTASFETPSLPL